ncbi:MAG: DUF6521 family protein [Methylococcales bacterium]
MSSLVDSLYQVKYNPFKYGEYLVSFYTQLVGVENNLLLSQLVIPLCSHPTLSNKLQNTVFGKKRTSTIWTVFSDQNNLYDLQERIDVFKELADQSLQYCLINDWLEIDPEKLSVSVLKKSAEQINNYKSALKLGKIFSNLSVIEIYALLGVSPR